MSIKAKLKKIDLLRRPVKKIKTWNEYFQDARLFNKYYMEECERKGNYDYRMLMLIHNIEKGMCMPNPRPFGEEKIEKLMQMFAVFEKNRESKATSVYAMTISILYQWSLFFKNHNWNDELVQKVDNFLDKYSDDLKCANVGYEVFDKNSLLLNENASFEEVVTSRKSVRNFSSEKLDEKDVSWCLKIAQAAPTACNRQMISILQVTERNSCDLITNTIYGSAGISNDTVNYFVITYDINAFDYYGERNQGYLNAGLVAMNFVNALHSKGIGTCFLQWANTAAEGKIVRDRLHISDHEKIAVVIAAGYYAGKETTAKSCRRKINEIFRTIV